MLKAITSWLRPRKVQPDDSAVDAPMIVVEADEEAADSHPVPYDEHLLERSRTQWQFGDWQTLAQLQRETLHHHPDRAKLALLAAGAHQQLGNIPAARLFARLAQDWGCSRKLISQILIAGVHNTLGCAAALSGRTQQSLKHFESSVEAASPGSDLRLLAQARARETFAKLGLPASPATRSARAPASNASADSAAMRALADTLQRQNAALSEQIRQQNAEMIKIRQSIESTVKQEMLNAAQQLEAFMGVQNFLNNGERLPGMHGWPISPDFALYLIELIDANDYDIIIEFGSGTSTVVIAKALARTAHHRSNKPATLQAAFEHLEHYHAQTQANLQQAGMQTVQLHLAPLQPYSAPNGKSYQYYSCHAALENLAGQLPMAEPRVLVLVDGPPASTGRHARYPAVPSVLTAFSGARIDILLDDYIREDEKEIAQLWLKDIQALGLDVNMTTRKMEKDACLISISHRM